MLTIAALLSISSIGAAEQLAEDGSGCVPPPVSIDDASVAEVAGLYRVDKERSKLKFCVTRLPFSEVEGEFGAFDGEFEIPVGSLEGTKLRVAIRPESVATGSGLIDSVVRGERFFSVKEHPEIGFVSTGVEITGDNLARLSGDLTLRGVTRPVSFNVYFAFDPIKSGDPTRRVSFEGGFEINRVEFGMDSLTGVVGDTVKICLWAEAQRVNPPAPDKVNKTP